MGFWFNSNLFKANTNMNAIESFNKFKQVPLFLTQLLIYILVQNNSTTLPTIFL